MGEFTCLEDCPPSLLVTVLTFLVIAVVGLRLSRWRRWALFAWIPTSYLLAAPFVFNGWEIDERGWWAMALGWIVALLAGLRSRSPVRSNDAA